MFGQQSGSKFQKYAFDLFHDSSEEQFSEFSSRTLGMTYSNGQARPFAGANRYSQSTSSQGYSVQYKAVSTGGGSSTASNQASFCAGDSACISKEAGEYCSGNAYISNASSYSLSPSTGGSLSGEYSYSSELLGALDAMFISC